MPYDPSQHHRRSIRLSGYDYAQCGAYFVTLCVQDRTNRFGDMVNDEMVLNDAGRMVCVEWEHLPKRFPTVEGWTSRDWIRTGSEKTDPVK